MIAKIGIPFLGLIVFLFVSSSCKDLEGGNCSVSCGGAGTGQPFVQTNTAYVSEEKCRQIGEDKGCRAAFCPPTGDPSDCYVVYQ